jgi:hypothetical protein
MPRPRTKERLSAKSRLALVRAKVERAKENLRNMESSLRSFDRQFPRAQVDIKSQKMRAGQIFRYHVPFGALTAAGDVVNNLRGALDHLISQLAMARYPGLTRKQLRTCQFPIADTLPRYEDTKRRHVKFIRPGAVKLIDTMKPFKSGNYALWLLSELDNTSKHRILLSVGKEVMCHADWIAQLDGFGFPFLYNLKSPQFSGITVRPKTNENRLPSGKETIGNVRIGKREALLPTLHYLVDTVDGIIEQFLPFLD